MQNVGGHISCPYLPCDLRFNTEAAFAQHLLEHNTLFQGTGTVTSFTCSACQFTQHFASADLLAQHQQDAHANRLLSQPNRHW